MFIKVTNGDSPSSRWLIPEHEGELRGGKERLPGEDGAEVIDLINSIIMIIMIMIININTTFIMIIMITARFLKDNIELERQQAIRDIMVKRDIARWLQVNHINGTELS